MSTGPPDLWAQAARAVETKAAAGDLRAITLLASGALDRLKAHATTDGPEQLPGHVADAMVSAGLEALDQLDTLGPPGAIYAPAIGAGPGGRWYQVWPQDLRPKK